MESVDERRNLFSYKTQEHTRKEYCFFETHFVYKFQFASIEFVFLFSLTYKWEKWTLYIVLKRYFLKNTKYIVLKILPKKHKVNEVCVYISVS